MGQGDFLLKAYCFYLFLHPKVVKMDVLVLYFSDWQVRAPSSLDSSALVTGGLDVISRALINNLDSVGNQPPLPDIRKPHIGVFCFLGLRKPGGLKCC